MSGGYELQRADARGEGVFATRSFQVGETVMVGVIEAELDRNHSHEAYPKFSLKKYSPTAAR